MNRRKKIDFVENEGGRGPTGVRLVDNFAEYSRNEVGFLVATKRHYMTLRWSVCLPVRP